ncbi:carboxypeptidase M32 [Pseudoflavitalea sp. G-6-1-2]|uniref:carboxypeptidase M32 n=1 Tax=Pseudoflavitalea sp. G-6-1-2 TaxID=2728841 RepID=UPI00146F51B4|nr:carboxypeptidase M32 [Pseudoflavitalea sp. G-6-1-2]NML20651.1 carboxypeptidase M32 [Pseudoflavitalea sp. G-6-1-2]
MSTSTSAGLYSQYESTMRRIADIRYAAAVLQWDQETYLPAKGAGFRGQQLATLSELAHNEFTSDRLGVLLNDLSYSNNLTDQQVRNIALTTEDYQRNKKFSAAFVRKLTEVINKSYHSWIEARKANDFSLFAGDLAELVKMKKEEAQILGYRHHPYDALLNDHDKGASVQLLDKVFDTIREPLRALLTEIQSMPQVNNSFLQQHFPKGKQWDLGMQLIRDMGYDLEAGRQDISEHPFTTNFNCKDVRVTTRIDENDLGNMVWSCIHEAGHALYEQGLPETQYGLPLGEPASYTIHESQSRLWENHVGRSLAWCQHYLPVFQQYFPEQLGHLTSMDFYRGINQVNPSLIRTEADELTYHFHVMIRYELEKALMEDKITTADIPDFWNESYLRYMNVKVPDHRQGCLQDVHWSHGSFGYFPTYSLGSFYAAQIFATAEKNIPGLDQQIQKGTPDSLLQWLRNQVHRYGRMYTSEELCKKVTGETLNISYFLQYLQRKYRGIYE